MALGIGSRLASKHSQHSDLVVKLLLFQKPTRKNVFSLLKLIIIYLSLQAIRASSVARGFRVLKLGFRLALSKVILLNIDCGDKNALSLLIFPEASPSLKIEKLSHQARAAKMIFIFLFFFGRTFVIDFSHRTFYVTRGRNAAPNCNNVMHASTRSRLT